MSSYPKQTQTAAAALSSAVAWRGEAWARRLGHLPPESYVNKAVVLDVSGSKLANSAFPHHPRGWHAPIMPAQIPNSAGVSE